MHPRLFALSVLAAAAFAACAPERAGTAGASPQTAPALDLDAYDLVDLTHAFGEDTLYWPTAPSRFEKTTIFEDAREDGMFYAAFAIATPEHGGTHMDAPYHFDANGDHAADAPLERLIAPAVVIDVSEQAAADPLYRLTQGDVLAFEAARGKIAPGTIVLLRTGWSARWPDAERYLGGTHADALAFPSFGPDAARLLVEERQAAALGLDTASTDYGPSQDFPVHRILGAANVPSFENLANLDRLPPTGAIVIALPMKIAGGSGGPLRAVALIPKREGIGSRQ